MIYAEYTRLPKAEGFTSKTLQVKQCNACQGCGKSNLQKAVQTTCKTCLGLGIVSSKKEGPAVQVTPSLVAVPMFPEAV